MMRVIKFLDDHLEEVIIFLSLAAMSVIIALQVVMRYAFQSSLSWSEEIARYLFIWLIYIGISYGAKKSAHISVTATDLFLTPRGQGKVKLLASVIFLIFAVCIFYYGWEVCSKIARLGQKSAALELNMWLVYLAVPTGFFLTCVRLCQNIFSQCKNLKNLDNSTVVRPAPDKENPADPLL